MLYGDGPSSGRCHGTYGTRGLRCHGQSCFEVIESGKKVRRTRYWCDRRHSNFDPFADDCPLERGGSGKQGR